MGREEAGAGVGIEGEEDGTACEEAGAQGEEDGAGREEAGAGTEGEEDEAAREDSGAQGEEDGADSAKDGSEGERIGAQIEEDGTNGTKSERSGTEREDDRARSSASDTARGEDGPRSEVDGEALAALSASRRSADTLAGDGNGTAALEAPSEGSKVLSKTSVKPPEAPSSTSPPLPFTAGGASRGPNLFLILASSARMDSSGTRLSLDLS